MVNGQADVGTVGGVWRPRGLGSGVVMYKCFGPKWGERHLVEIECPVELLVGCNIWILSRETQEVERKFDLGKEVVP